MATQVLTLTPMVNPIKQYIIDPSLTHKCHIDLAESDKPVPAIVYQSKLYSFFKTCPDWETTEKIAARLKDQFIITEIKKGWAIWVYEMASSIKQYVVDLSLTRKCHIDLADSDKPVAAIAYQGKFYSFFRTCPNWETTEKIAARLKDQFIITEIKKGWAIWVYEF